LNELPTEESLDIQAIVKELKQERDRLSRAISALEGTDMGPASQMSSPAANLSAVPAKEGKGLTPEGRKRLSDMMKKRWAEKRKKSLRGGK
jgi:hypothetical protein